MTNILFISSSPRGGASHSTKVAEQFIAGLLAEDASATVTRRDLNRDPLPHVDETFLGALFSAPDTHNEEQARLVALSDQLVDELFAADVVVISSAMINFTIHSTLKSWFDFVARSGKTFRYTAKGPEGLVKGKKVVVVTAKGGIYSDGPMKPHDYQLPWIRFILGFLGMTDVEVIQVEGVALGPDKASEAVAAATTHADAHAKTLARQAA